MNQEKYIGRDVHQATISVAVMGSSGKLIKELARSYLTLTQDVSRVMARIKALYRSWAIHLAVRPCIFPI
jgi:hypothetical protein